MFQLLLLSYAVALAGAMVYAAYACLMPLLPVRPGAADKTGRSPVEAEPLGRSPSVTVQLPLYNERHVAVRLLEAVSRLDWSSHRLEVQVLDDSDDDTSRTVAEAVRHLRAGGLTIAHIRRADRLGAKAGALQNGLKQARGDVVAVFDADFLPSPDFLRRMMPSLAQADVACVQARWGHINESASALTRAIAIGIDAHMSEEQAARARSGALVAFHGTAGIWRREAIDAVGGWAPDTLAEDRDLSCRVQALGWRIVYRPDVVCRAEVPMQIQAFRRQQVRWAEGSIQCARRHLPGILARPGIPALAKVEAALHWTRHLFHALLLFLVVALPVLVMMGRMPLWIPGVLGLGGLGIVARYTVAGRRARLAYPHALGYALLLMLVGIALARSYAAAVARGLWRDGGDFLRTPKFAAGARLERQRDDPYMLHDGNHASADVALAAWAGLGATAAVTTGQWAVFPLFLLFTAAHVQAAFYGLWHRPSRPTRAAVVHPD